MLPCKITLSDFAPQVIYRAIEEREDPTIAKNEEYDSELSEADYEYFDNSDDTVTIFLSSPCPADLFLRSPSLSLSLSLSLPLSILFLHLHICDTADDSLFCRRSDDMSRVSLFPWMKFSETRFADNACVIAIDS